MTGEGLNPRSTPVSADMHSRIVALAFHHAQLEASAFREEYDPDTFDDPTKPKLDMIHKVRPTLLSAQFVLNYPSPARRQADQRMERRSREQRGHTHHLHPSGYRAQSSVYHIPNTRPKSLWSSGNFRVTLHAGNVSAALQEPLRAEP